MRHRHSGPPAPRSSFAGFRFPPDVIMIAVRWYLRYGLSYREVEELLAERGVEVDHVTVYRRAERPPASWPRSTSLVNPKPRGWVGREGVVQRTARCRPMS